MSKNPPSNITSSEIPRYNCWNKKQRRRRKSIKGYIETDSASAKATLAKYGVSITDAKLSTEERKKQDDQLQQKIVEELEAIFQN